MRKFWIIAILLAIFVFPVMAQDTENTQGTMLTYQVINTSAIYTDTNFPVTSIYPNDRILGWAIMKQDLTKNAEYVVALYDQTGAIITNTSGECLGESESSDSPVDNTVWLPWARTIDNGVLVRQGPNTVVTIYFAR